MWRRISAYRTRSSGLTNRVFGHYAVGPGGVWIMSPEGKHLGTILAGDLTNLALGDADGKTLYMTGRRPRAELYRIRVKILGIRP